jgi:hypothetical protein
MRTFRLLCVVPVLAAFIFSGCGSEEILPEGNPEEWWNNPGAITDYLAAVGVSPLLNKRAEGPARTYAEADGRAKMAAVLKAKMQQLVENWSKDVGDLTKEASFSSYINNEAFTRQHVDAVIAGAKAHTYHKAEGNIYVLMILENPTKWVANLADDTRDAALQDETLFKTEVMKNEFRDRMDGVKTKAVEQQQKLQENFQKKVGG